MASITISSASFAGWQRDSDVELRIFALQSFVAADNSLVVAGNPTADSTSGDNFFTRVACTLSGTTLTIASCTLLSTTDSPDNASATYGAFFFTTEGEPIAAFGKFVNFVLPSSPTTTTWAAIEQAQLGAL